MRCLVSDETLKKLEKLKGLLAHSHPSISLSDLLDKLCDLGIKEWDKGEKCVRERKLKTPAPARVTVRQEAKPQKLKRSHIPNEIQRAVWCKAHSQCEQCQSTYALEIDHILPKAKGGEDTLENLRLLCRPCNQRAAIHHYGINKMQQHLKNTADKNLWATAKRISARQTHPVQLMSQTCFKKKLCIVV